MHTTAKRTFWIGLFVVVFDVTWRNIPLLPNLLGYVLLAAALTQFGVYSRWFSWARVWAVGLAGVEAIRLLVDRLTWPLFISELDPWTQIGSRLGAIPLLLSAALYWSISSGFIDCLLRLGDTRLARRLALVRTASLVLSLLNAGAVLWRTNAPRLTINITGPNWTAGGLGLIVLLIVLLIGVSEIGLWFMALRHLPDTLEPAPARPAINLRLVKRITWGLLALVPLAVGFFLLLRAPQPAVLLQLAGGRANGHTGSRAVWSPDGTRLAVGGTNMPARVYDPASGNILFETADRTTYDVHDLTWSPDGMQLLSASTGIFIDDGANGAQLACLADCPGHDNGSVWSDSADWSPDGSTVALAAGGIQLFDTRTMTYTRVISSGEASWSTPIRVAYSPDGSLLASSGSRGQILIWTSEGQLLRTLIPDEGDLTSDIAWSPDGTRLAVADDYNVVEVWDVHSGQRVRTFLLSTELDRRLLLRPHHQVRDWSSAVTWSPDGRFLAAGSTDATAAVWELDSGEQVLRLSGQTEQIGDIEFSPDGRRIVTASHDETVWIWDSSSIYE